MHQPFRKAIGTAQRKGQGWEVGADCTNAKELLQNNGSCNCGLYPKGPDTDAKSCDKNHEPKRSSFVWHFKYQKTA